MKSGQRPAPKRVKEARGTVQKARERNEIVVSVERATPIAPNYLSEAAKAIWDEELSRVTYGQTTELDSSLFARYCALEALIRDQFAQGIVPKAAYLVELRRTAEAMGIGGASSRIGGLKSNEQAPTSAFTVRAR